MTIISSASPQYPALNDEALKISTRAIAEGYTLPCVVARRVRGDDFGRDPGRSDQVAALFAVRGGAARRRCRRPSGARCRPARAALIDGDLRARLCQASRLVYGAATSPSAPPRSARRRCPAARPITTIRIRNQTTTNRTADDIHAARPERGQAHPRRDGGGREEGRLRQPRGDDRRPAHQPQILCQDARRADAGDGARD